jgi:hypothetical protein
VANDRDGLLWIGKAHYETPDAFTREADAMGVSRKIKAIPHGFELGKHWVFIAHVQAIQRPSDDPEGDPVRVPGIFHAYKPSRIDLVVESDDPEQLPERAKSLKDKFGGAARLLKVVAVEEEVALV